MKKNVLIIIPAYNEEGNIEAVLEQLEKPEIADIADILVMNDHSSDKTNMIVKKHNHALVTHVFNLDTEGDSGWDINMQSEDDINILFRWMQTVSMMYVIFRLFIRNLQHPIQMETFRILFWVPDL